MERKWPTYVVNGVGVAAAIATVLMFVLIIGERNKIEGILQAREPTVEKLEGILQASVNSYRITVPIHNSARSRFADAHKVQVVMCFNEDNLIQEVIPGSYRLIGGGEGSSSATFEINILPSLSTRYPAVIVGKPDLPWKVEIGWAEKTGWEALTPSLGE